ncbi:MAG: FAD-linked oxidase C-terminal domain-containing protein [Acetobacteraceae bacterium]|nr:FAD-linked oxidase C-terminal domain-containing protein [Acetobacteraceae bacterium]
MIALPPADPAVLARRDAIVADLIRLVGAANVIAEPLRLKAYETDAFTAYRRVPLAVCLPTSTAAVAAALRYCTEHGIRVVPRAAGTSLSGGALPLEDAVVIGVSRLNRILEISLEDRLVRVEAGVTNLAVTRAVEGDGFFYAPDPSSQLACMIAGNIAMNSGGAHCLKYGVTANNLLGLTLVTAQGEVIEVGGGHLDTPGYDWLGLICGSEGQLGIVTEATLRILRAAEGARAMLVGFRATDVAAAAVADIIGSGIIPVALEFMDKPCIRACEDFAHAGYPLEAEALLIIEVEGNEQEQDALLAKLETICRRHDPLTVRVARTAEESAAIWKGRKGAFGAVGRISPDYLCMDGTIPPARLPEAMRRIEALSRQYGLMVANVFHAGDGNLHPLILFDANDAESFARAEALGADILRLCVELGGCLTGEHGVGIEKRDLMHEQFSAADLAQQARVKRAFDPGWLLNPHKVFPPEFAEAA